MVGDALSRFWHSRYYKVSRISKMLLSTVNSGPPNWTKSRTFILWNQSTRKTQILMGGRFGSIQAGAGF